MNPLPNAKVYVDGANMFYAQRKLGWSFDWAKIRRFLETERRIMEWRYYLGVKEGDEKMSSYLRYLDAIGFSVFTKPLKKIKTGPDQYVYKANCDVELAVDAITDKADMDEIVLWSGDSDFKYLVQKLKSVGRNVSIFSSRKTVSWELKLEARRVTYLEDIRAEIERAK